MTHPQNGNVLFLILIAVALFAALSYAVVSSSRGSGSDSLSDDKAGLIAAEITQYGTSMESAILRMRLSGGCSDTDISFEASGSAYGYAHTPPVANKCKVFHPAGGGIVYQTPRNWFTPTSDLDYVIWATGDLNVVDVGTTAPDLVLTLYDLNEKVCNQLNRKLGINYSGSTPPTEDIDAATVEFNGVYHTRTENIGDDSGSVFKGKLSGCFDDYGSSVYYHVLIPR